MVEQRGNVGLVPSKILTLQPHECGYFRYHSYSV